MKRKEKAGRNKTKIYFNLLKNLSLNLVLLCMGILIYALIIKVMESNQGIFMPIQIIEAKFIYLLQRPFVDAALNGTTLLYKSFAVDVGWDCIGLRQSLFFLVLVFSFYQVSWRKKAYSLIFIPLILLLNIARIALIYPLSLMFGAGFAERFHDSLYAYGNGILIFLFFGLWFYIFALEDHKSRRKKKS